jgi:RNA recognition motif-containing protein
VFDIGEKHLRKLLAPYGEIEDLEVPLNPNNSKCNRGFAFVEFKAYRSCEKAIKELNQSTFKGRTIVLDFSVNKQRFMTKQLEDSPEDKQEE